MQAIIDTIDPEFLAGILHDDWDLIEGLDAGTIEHPGQLGLALMARHNITGDDLLLRFRLVMLGYSLLCEEFEAARFWAKTIGPIQIH